MKVAQGTMYPCKNILSVTVGLEKPVGIKHQLNSDLGYLVGGLWEFGKVGLLSLKLITMCVQMWCCTGFQE